MTPWDIWNFRKRYNLNGGELAALLGVHPAQVSRWERGAQTIPAWLEPFLK